MISLLVALAAPAAALLYAWEDVQRRRARGLLGRAAWVFPAEAVPAFRWFVRGLLLAALASLAAALSTREVPSTASRPPVAIALDTSLSMGVPDVGATRLELAQQAARRLARASAGNVGLLVFAGEAYVQSPLTDDLAMIEMLIDAVEPGWAPLPGSSLAAALRAGVDVLAPQGGTLLILTDGEDTRGGWPQAAREAREAGVEVHALAIGSAEGGPVPGRTAVVSKMQRTALQAIAVATRGTAGTGEAALAALEQRLQRPVAGVRHKDSFFRGFLWLTAVLLSLELAVAGMPESLRPGVRKRRMLVPALATVIFVAGGARVGAQTLAVEVWRANRAYARGQWTEAERLYRSALRRQAGCWEGWLGLGLTQAGQGRGVEAMETFRTAAHFAPPGSRAIAYFDLGNVLVDLDRLESAAGRLPQRATGPTR